MELTRERLEKLRAEHTTIRGYFAKMIGQKNFDVMKEGICRDGVKKSHEILALIAAAEEGLRLREEVAVAQRRHKVLEMALLAAAKHMRCHEWGENRCPALDVTCSQSDENTYTCPAGLIRWAEAEIAKEVEACYQDKAAEMAADAEADWRRRFNEGRVEG